MAKTESTAVNQLIANIQGRPLQPVMDADDQDVDLNFEERTIPTHDPGRSPRGTAMAPHAPPPPMSRSRSASGTEVPALTSNARISTARVSTMPPLPNGNHNPRATLAGPGFPSMPPPRSSTLPPPLRHSSPRNLDVQGTPAPELRPSSPPPPPPKPSAPDAPLWLATPVPSLPSLNPYPAPPPHLPPSPFPPPSLPAVSARAPSRGPSRPYPDATAPAQLVDGADWFESSQAVPSLDEAEIGTQGVRAKKKPPIGMLVGTACVCALVGVFVGGYLTFDGAGGAKPAAATTAAPAKPATAAKTAAVTAPAAAAAIEPAKTEPVAAAAIEPAAAQAIEPAKTDPVAAAAIEPAKTEPVAAAAIEPAKIEPAVAAAAIEPAKTEPAPAATLVDVLFLSSPSGANVVLVDGSRTIPIGPTPVSASIDVSHSYEAVFALEGHQTRIEQLDPRRDRRFTVDLRSGKTKIKHGAPVLPEVAKAAKAEPDKAEKTIAKSSSSSSRHHDHGTKVATVDWNAAAAPKVDVAKKAEPAPEPEAAPAKVEVAKKVDVAKKAEPKQQASDDEDPNARPGASAKASAAAKAPSAPAKAPSAPAKVASAPGPGVLMVASKPPCEIIIDGKATGLTTPQRSIELPAGSHKVTLVNKDAGIKKVIAVKVTAGKPTKLIQDYTSELK